MKGPGLRRPGAIVVLGTLVLTGLVRVRHVRRIRAPRRQSAGSRGLVGLVRPASVSQIRRRPVAARFRAGTALVSARPPAARSTLRMAATAAPVPVGRSCLPAGQLCGLRRVCAVLRPSDAGGGGGVPARHPRQQRPAGELDRPLDHDPDDRRDLVLPGTLRPPARGAGGGTANTALATQRHDRPALRLRAAVPPGRPADAGHGASAHARMVRARPQPVGRRSAGAAGRRRLTAGPIRAAL